VPSPRLRAKRRLGAFLPIEDEVAGEVRRADYVWKLSKFMLPQPGDSLDTRRRRILQARDHEIAMFGLYPDGPASAAESFPRRVPTGGARDDD